MNYLKLLFLICTISAYSQEVTLTWAEKIKTKGFVSILGGKDGNYYTRHTDKDDRLVCRAYDSKLTLKNEQIVNFNLDEKKYSYLGAYFIKDKIVHFMSENKRKEDKNFLYSSTTDLGLKTSDKVFVLDEADEEAMSFGARSISPDSTKIVVYHEVKGKKREPNTLNFKVYNPSFTEVLLDKSAQLNIKSKNFSTEEIRVDNNGNVYVLAKVTKEKDEKEKDHTKFYYKLIVFGKDGSGKDFDFDYQTKDIESIDLIAGENNTLICTGFLKTLGKGFLSSNKKTLISDELFSVIIDCNTLTMQSSKKIELNGLYPEKPKKSEDYVPYKVRDIFFKKDGGYVLIAEQFKIVEVRTKNGTYYIYYYCDIATIHINNKSEVVSVSKMPKYQKNASNPSVISTYKDGKTYIVYEDLEKNLNAENDKETKRSSASMFSSDSKNALFLLTVADSGEMKKEIIYSYKESKIRPRIGSSRVINKGEIMLNADDQLGVLKIK
ncbi:hypothetical protein [Flavobacterium sp.]|uniref:hypothetical protein n=1 Tax=Flavobacterium sp. TaxID=239 RepID=UPI003750A797